MANHSGAHGCLSSTGSVYVISLGDRDTPVAGLGNSVTADPTAKFVGLTTGDNNKIFMFNLNAARAGKW